MTARRPRSDEDGVGAFNSLLGALVILTMILVATHVLLALQRRTVVDSVAFDVARRVAVDGGMSAADAEGRARDLLHDPSAQLTWRVGDDGAIELRVTTRSPTLIGIGPLRSLATIRRTVHVRREQLQDGPTGRIAS